MRFKHLHRHCLVLLLTVAGTAASAEVELVDTVKNGDIKALRTLLAGRADVNAAEADGTTALHWAVRRDDAEATALLIRAGSNVNAANRYDVRPLSLACINGNGQMVEMLL